MTEPKRAADDPVSADQAGSPDPVQGVEKPATVKEIGGPRGPEPTRYGDWEKNGRCIDF